MKWSSILLLVFVLINFTLASVFNVYPKFKIEEVKGDVGEPLILTPLIENGNIEKARNLSEVVLEEFLGVKSYSGYLTVDKAFNSNLFFWFFPAEKDYELAPVLLWLQGGPGSSSLYALFSENGPVQFNDAGELELREYAWTKTHSVIYIDNPVGTGYSFTENGFAQNETKVGKDLHSALQQFFLLFPELQSNDFIVTGESYAGKYVPSISYTIHKNNPTADVKINLKGLAIGNGLCDPRNQMVYSEYLYQIGLVDSNDKKLFAEYEKEIIEAIDNKEFEKAYHLFDELINGDLTPGPALFKNVTGFDDYFNYVTAGGKLVKSDFASFIQSEKVRKAIHVGNLTYNSGVEVEENLLSDVMDSIAPWLSELINNYRVLIYNGQLDIIVAYPLTVNYLKTLKFNGDEEYKLAQRIIWKVDNDIAGYGKIAGNLTEVLVRDSGHMVPLDQPKWGYDLIYNFVRNTLFKN